MTKDYAKKRRLAVSSRTRRMVPSPLQESAMPGWIWMGAGLLLGLLVSLIFYWKSQGHFLNEALHTASTQAVKKVKAHKKTEEKVAAETVTRFDFYTVLPNIPKEDAEPAPTVAEVKPIIPPTTPAVEMNPALAAAPVTKTEPMPAPLKYLVQAGSFHQLSQAETLKAELAMNGYEASIQIVKSADKDTLYRVTIGPFETKEKAVHSQQILKQAQQLHSVVLKIGV